MANFAAIRGKFGSTEYYLITMRVSELVNRLIIPKEMEGWDDLSVDEIFQRDVNYKRVKEQIAPYLSSDPDRFIGAFIVTIKNHENLRYDNLSSVMTNIPGILGATFGEDVGVLTFNGGEVLIPLDGQHRLAALKFAISGKDEKGADIPALGSNIDLGNDSCSVILVKDDLEKSRKIFNKVNRYAKGTSKADNLLTGDDDICAVITRSIVASDLIGARIVKMASSNTLSASSKEFTTLSVLYDISKKIIEYETGAKLDTQKLPNSQDQTLMERIVRDFWKKFLELPVYEQAIRDREESGDDRRKEIRESSLACKPVVMKALAEAFIKINAGPEGSEGMTIEEFTIRAGGVDWSPDNPQWQNVLLIGNKIIAGPAAVNLAARYIAYLLGGVLEEYELERLRESLVAVNADMPDPAF